MEKRLVVAKTVLRWDHRGWRGWVWLLKANRKVPCGEGTLCMLTVVVIKWTYTMIRRHRLTLINRHKLVHIKLTKSKYTEDLC